MSSRMRAVKVSELRGLEAFEIAECPVPEPAAGEIRVRVRAAGCNFADILASKGQYQVKPALPYIPGAEFSGEVDAVGEGVERHRRGDRVLGTCGFGAFAEYVVVSEDRAFRMPDGMSFPVGAAIPIVYPTSYAALVFRAALAKGETLLVHAAAGGVGLAAVQIGRALGARVIATAGGADKLAIAREAGAEVGIDYREEDFVARVLAETDGRGADVIYDSVGGDTFDRSLKCIAWNGRLVVVGFASGRIPEVAANRIMLKNIAVTGIHWPPYFEKEPARVVETFEGLFRLHEQGAIVPLVSEVRPLEDVREALTALAGRVTHGKVILEP